MNRTTANQALTNRLDQELANFEIAKQTTKVEDLSIQQIRISVLAWAMSATKEEIANELQTATSRFNAELANGATGKSVDLRTTEIYTLSEAHTIKSALA